MQINFEILNQNFDYELDQGRRSVVSLSYKL